MNKEKKQTEFSERIRAILNTKRNTQKWIIAMNTQPVAVGTYSFNIIIHTLSEKKRSKE